MPVSPVSGVHSPSATLTEDCWSGPLPVMLKLDWSHTRRLGFCPSTGSGSLSSIISGVTVAEVATTPSTGEDLDDMKGPAAPDVFYVGGQIELAQLASSLRREGKGAAAEQQHRLMAL